MAELRCLNALSSGNLHRIHIFPLSKVTSFNNNCKNTRKLEANQLFISSQINQVLFPFSDRNYLSHSLHICDMSFHKLSNTI